MLADYLNRVDSDLEQLAAAGDGQAFDALYERHVSRIYDFAFRLVKDGDEAQDIAQETFIRAWRALKPGEKSASVSTWLFTIARNLSLTCLEKNRRTTPLVEPEHAVDEEASTPPLHLVDERKFADPEAAARASDLARLVWDAVDFLNPKDASILDLHIRQGLESAEIADVLGISKGNAYTILSRLKSNLEEAVTTLLIVRNARDNCSKLDALLSAQSGPLISPEVRRLVMRHVDSCPVCDEERKKLISPASLFGAFAMVPLPFAQRARGADAMRPEWLGEGATKSTGVPATEARGSKTSGRNLSGNKGAALRRSFRYPSRLVTTMSRHIRGVIISWPYATGRRRAATVTIIVAVLIALMGFGVAVQETTAQDGGGGNRSHVLGVVESPSATRAARTSVPPTPTPTPEPSASPSQTPPSTATGSATPPPTISVPPSACTAESSTPSGTVTEEPAFASELESLMNSYRAGKGLQPLPSHASLLSAARQHSEFVSLTRWWLNHGGYFIHCDSLGHDMYDRAVAAGYPPAYVGENVVWGTSGRTPQQAFADIMATTGHEDPADARFHAVGTACFRRSDSGEYSCVQVIAE